MKNIQEEIKKYLEERDWHKLKPADLAKSISIEAAELLEIFQWNDEDLERVKSDPAKLQKIKKELADVFIYSLEMSALLDLDAEKIIMDKLEHVRNKYPAEVVKNKSEEYFKIKENYRRKGL